MKDVSFLPNVISFEHKPVNKKITVSVPQIAQVVQAISLRGVVNKEGKLLLDPGGMIVEHPSPGLYKIIHNLGYTNTSISVSIIEPPGGAELKEHNPMYFVVQTQLDGNPIDMDWCFSLMRTL